jgi:dTDP-4-amino-4,6-dideoxygalactose transaminase
MIQVTKAFFPPIESYQYQIQRIWNNEWLTNRGPLLLELEGLVKSHLAIQRANMIIMNNGTIPLQIALKLLGNGGEIITTPFSYVATTSSIVWENCKPVFVDIHPNYLTIDETKIEQSITDKTTCILATHVFGNPCNIEVIEKIANKYQLKVIYDAAHCFGVKYKNKSIFEYGDISTCSFHATKLFHTGEGGALFTSNDKLFHECFYSHAFGHLGPTDFHGVGINGKLSELQAAMGLSVLPYIDLIVEERKKVVDFYLSSLNLEKIKTIQLMENTVWNYSYFPIILDSEATLIKLQDILNKNKIFPRRYFYPSLNTIEYTKGIRMPISESISERVLCLPLFVGLSLDEIELIVNLINSNV